VLTLTITILILNIMWKIFLPILRPVLVQVVKYLLKEFTTRIANRDGVITPQEQAFIDELQTMIDNLNALIKK